MPHEKVAGLVCEDLGKGVALTADGRSRRLGKQSCPFFILDMDVKNFDNKTNLHIKRLILLR